ncbi:MAG: alpha-ketoacid dehydrogenase subunit beta [Rudaea sp.]
MTFMTFRDALRQALQEEMRRDPAVFVMGEDVGRYGGAYAVTKGLQEEFGADRVIDTPMSEGTIVGAAAGAAMIGGRPVAEIMYVDFMALTMDQLVNQAAKIHYMFGGQIRVPMVIRTQQGTGRGAGAQHSQSLEAWFAHVPGLKVVAPSVPADAKGLLKAAIRDDNPVVFLEHKGLYPIKGDVPEGEYVTPLGKADVKREGRDVTLITYSHTFHLVMQAAAALAAAGIEAEVVDVRTLRPLDMETIIRSAAKTRRAVVVHEAVITGGVGAEIAARLGEALFGRLLAPVMRVGASDVPLPANSRLEKEVIPDVTRIATTARQAVQYPARRGEPAAEGLPVG